MARLSMIRRQESTPNRTRGGRKAFRGLVLHIAQGTYEGTISWQKNPDSNVSSEFVIGRKPGEWAQMMDLDDYGWTQREGNGYWVASENAGYVDDGLTDWQVEANAQLLAWLHVHKGVPLAVADHPGERGLGHHSMDRDWLGEQWGHEECPGPRVLSRKAEIVARARAIIEGDDMSVADVTGGLDKPLPFRSEGVGTWARAEGWGDVSARALLEYAFASTTRTERMLVAALAAIEGLDTAAILARIDEHAAAEAQRDAAAAAERAELRALVERGLSGELAADEVIRLIGERLAGPAA